MVTCDELTTLDELSLFSSRQAGSTEQVSLVQELGPTTNLCPRTLEKEGVLVSDALTQQIAGDATVAKQNFIFKLP